MKLRVAWLSFAALQKTAGGWTSEVASARYRMTIPARALQDLDYESVVIDAASHKDYRALIKRAGRAQVAIFGKLVAPPEAFVVEAPKILEFAHALRSAGVKVVADFSDDGFREPVRGPYFRGLANGVDAVVASTERLAGILREETPAPVFVVTDPVEGPGGAPRVEPSQPLRLLWYGHPTNLDTLELGMRQLACIDVPMGITVVTTPGAGGEAMRARFVPWSTKAVFGELAACDAVLIPSNPGERRRAVKSPNRFTEAVWAGRFVIAHPLPAYDALSAYGWVGEDLAVGVEWMLRNPSQALARVRAGQEKIETSFTPRAVAQQWRAALFQ